jgi:hypothetical protein
MTLEERGPRADAELDPWGLLRIEKLLVGLDGVASLKIVPDGRGGIDEIHVLSASDLGPKQVVRNIESALLAEFGLQIDHRKISIAKVRGAEATAPLAKPAATAAAAPEPSRRLLLESLHIERSAGQKVTCKVELLEGGSKYTGEAEGPDFESARMETAATAVLNAVQQASGPNVNLSLQGVSRATAFGRSFVIAVVNGAVRRETISLAGIGKVLDSPEEAAVFASLQAINRWIGER